MGLVAFVGLSLLSHTAVSISTSIAQGLKLLYGISKDNKPFRQFLTEEDIEAKLHLIQTVIKHYGAKLKELPNDTNDESWVIIKQNQSHSQIPPNLTPEQLALYYLQDSVTKIVDLLEIINEQLELHQNKWFSRWRYFEYDMFLVELRRLNHQLDGRWKWLLMFVGNNHDTCTGQSNINLPVQYG